MLDKLQKNKKYIVLKDGNNYGLMVGFIVMLIICVLLFTSKSWLPDSRENLTTKVGSNLLFSLNEVNVKGYSVDNVNNIGEVTLVQKKSSEKEKFELSYKVFDDKGNVLPFTVINGNVKKEREDSVLMYQDTLIQFGVYEDIYFVRIEVSQKETTSQSIYIDYRNFEQKQVLEKGKDYLINLDEEKEVLLELEERLLPFVEKEKKLAKELNGLNETKSKKEVNKKRIEEIKKELELIANEIKPIQKDVEKQRNKIKEME